ncbi:unnamed protein product, partial [Rotaria sp. Silwood1]
MHQPDIVLRLLGYQYRGDLM